MTRYWFEFKANNLPPGLIIGCGVTAYDYIDAISLLSEKIFKEKDIPELRNKKENVDITTLDKGHVIPNMKDLTIRGIWFPSGYE